MIKFDEHGHLQPYSVSELSLTEFQANFVDGLADKIHRRALFKNYLVFLEEVKKTFGFPFFQWIAGSFITQKELPGDIDCVTFLPYDLLVKKAAPLHLLKSMAKSRLNLDTSFCPIAKWNHRYFEECKKRESEWLKLYGFSRPDRNNVVLPKGIIKINFFNE